MDNTAYQDMVKKGHLGAEAGGRDACLPQRYPAIIGGNLPMGKYLKIARLQLLDQTGQQYGILKATAA